MDKDKLHNLKDVISNNLQNQITNLQSVKDALEEDLKSCSNEERAKNEKLLNATINLLEELKAAQTNIKALINRDEKSSD